MKFVQSPAKSFCAFSNSRAQKKARVLTASTSTAARLIVLSAAACGGSMLPRAVNADVYGNDGGINLNLPGSWADETNPANTGVLAPGAGDIARWDSVSASTGGTFNLSGPISWLGLSIANPTGAVTIGSAADNTSGGALTIGASGIDMSAATFGLTIADTMSVSANQNWNIISGQTLSISNPLTLNGSSAATVTILGNGNVSLNNAAAVVGGSGGFTKFGTGTLTLGALNTFTGPMTVNNGTLLVQMATATPSSNSPPADNLATLVTGGGTITATGGARASGTSTPAWIANITTLNVSSGASTFMENRGASARVIDTFNGFNRSAGATVNLIDCFTASTGANNANSGGYRAASTAWSAATNTGYVVNGVIPYLTYTTTVTSSSPGVGAQGLALAANSPLATSWFVPAGTGNNGAALANFNSSTATTLGVNAQSNVDVVTNCNVPTGTTVNTLRFNSGNSNTLTINAGDTLIDGSGGVLITNAYANHQGHITGGTLEGGNPGSGSANDLMILDYDDPNQGTNSKLTIDSVIADNTTNGNTFGTATALTKSGIGLLVLTNTANTYTGNTYINGGIVNIAGEGSSFGSLGAVSSSVVFSSGTLQFASNFNLSNSRNLILADKGGTLDTNGFSTAVGGVISGSGSLTKIGAGTLRLSGSNTYTGTTAVAAGTLSVLNTAGSATGTGTVSIAAGAYLTGSGSIGGSVVLASSATNGSGGHIDPGNNGVGTITVGSLTMNVGSTADLEFANDTSYDQVAATNLILNGGQINLFQPGSSVLPYSSNGTHTYDIFSYTGTLSGSPGNLSVYNPVAGFNYSFGSVAPSGMTPGYVTLTASGTAQVVISQWNTSTNSQVWSSAANWTAGVPHNAGDIASFLTVAGQTGPIAVTLDAPESVGELDFNDTYSYTITASGSGALTLDNGAGGSNASVNDLGGVHTITAPITLNSNTTVTTANASSQVTFNGNISGAGNLTIGTVAAGTFGTVILTGTNSYADPTTINAGNTLQLGTNSSTGSLGGTNLVNNGTFIVNRSNAYTIAGNITGFGSVTQAGPGMLTLSGVNTYTGATSINAGTLQLGSATGIGGGTLTVAAGALLDVNGYNASVGAFSGAGNVDDVAGAATTTLTINFSSGTTTFSGAIKNTTGVINLVKAGGGSMTFSGSNTYSGSTALGIYNSASAPAAGTLTLTGTIGGGTTRGSFTVGDAASLTINGGTLIASSLSQGSQVSSVVSITGGGSLNVSGGNLGVDSDNGNGGGYLSLVSGTITANSVTIGRTNSTYTALVTGGASTTVGLYVDGGTLNIATTLSVGDSSGTNSTASMRIDTGSVTVGGTTTITNNQGSSPARYSLLDIAGGTFTSNDTTGAGIQIGGGGTFATPVGELLVRGASTVVAANTITLGGPSQTGGNIVLEMLGGTIYLGSGGIVNSSNGVSPTVNFGGTTYATAPTLAANASWSSAVSMNLTNSNSGLAPIVQTANSSGGAETVTLSGFLSGNGGLNKTGAGVLILDQNNAYSGGTVVNAGTLVLADGLGAVSNGNVTINAGGAMVVQQSTISAVNALVAQGNNANGGYWNGPGINSSSAAANTAHLTALGTILNDNPLNAGTALFSTFEGASTFDGDVLVKYTYYGDTNLNGVVDGSDYSRIDAAYANNQNTSNPAVTGWYNGDFNYDHVIDGSDYTLMDNAFNSQTAVFSASIAAQIAGPGGVSGSLAVPEPTTLGIIGFGVAGLLGRRRRK